MPEVEIVPFPADKLYLAWEILNEDRESNFDDYGPQDYASFRDIMLKRLQSEVVFAVKYAREIVGIIGYSPTTDRTGKLNGICFRKKVHGTNITKTGVKKVFDRIFAAGVKKISIMYFASNKKIHKFLKKFGTVQEGYLASHTIKNGEPEDILLMALFKG